MVLLHYYFPELWITVAIKPHCQPNLKPHFGQGWAGWGVSQSSSRHTNALIASSTSRWVFLCSVFSHLSYSQYRNHGSFWLCHLSYSPGGSCLGVYVEQDFLQHLSSLLCQISSEQFGLFLSGLQPWSAATWAGVGAEIHRMEWSGWFGDSQRGGTNQNLKSEMQLAEIQMCFQIAQKIVAWQCLWAEEGNGVRAEINLKGNICNSVWGCNFCNL